MWDLNRWDDCASSLAARYDFAPYALLALPAPGEEGAKACTLLAGTRNGEIRASHIADPVAAAAAASGGGQGGGLAAKLAAMNQLEAPAVVCKGHSNQVTGLYAPHNPDILYSCSRDGSARRWLLRPQRRSRPGRDGGGGQRHTHIWRSPGRSAVCSLLFVQPREGSQRFLAATEDGSICGVSCESFETVGLSRRGGSEGGSSP